MADNETRVIYKAIADFSAIAREARQAKRALRELRQEEAKLNAQSAATKANTTATTARTKAIQSSTTATQQHTKATGTNAQATKQHTTVVQTNTQTVLGHAAALRQNAGAHNASTGAAQRALPVMNAHASTLGRAHQATQKLSAAQTFLGNSMGRNNGNWGNFNNRVKQAIPYIERINKGFDRLGKWRPKLTPPFIALVPLIAGLLALVNPLVAGLGALGGAAIGLASSLGRVAGAALGAIPALFALLSVVAALKVAFGGIGGVFSAYKAQKKAGGGGGGGGGGAAQPAEISQAEKVARAREMLRRATENLRWAEEDLAEARKDYLKRLKDLEQAAEDAANAEKRATAQRINAQKTFDRIMNDPNSTKAEKMAAAAALEDAKTAEEKAKEHDAELQDELKEMKKKGMKGDREVIMAQRALTDAIYAQRDAQIDLINAKRGDAKASGGAAGGANAYLDALNKLSPSARKFVLALIAMDKAWTKVKRNTQEAFFSKIVDDVKLLKGLLPSVESLLTDTAGALGDVAHEFLTMIGSKEWKDDLVLLGKGNVPIIKNIGRGLNDLWDVFKDLSIIAQPFLEELTKGFKKGTENLRNMVNEARKSGSLQKWLMGDKETGSRGVLQTLQQWWRIIKNIGKTLFNYAKAASDFANWISDGIEKATEGWLKTSEDATKKDSPFKKWLEDIKPLLSEISRMFSTFFKWFTKESGETKNIEQMTEIFRKITDELAPKLGQLFDSLSKANIGPKFVDALIKIVDLITTLVDGPGAAVFFDTLNALLDTLLYFLKMPVIGDILKGLIGGFAAIAAMSFVAKFTGLENLIGWLIRLYKTKGLTKFLGGLKNALAKLFGITGKRFTGLSFLKAMFFGIGDGAKFLAGKIGSLISKLKGLPKLLSGLKGFKWLGTLFKGGAFKGLAGVITSLGSLKGLSGIFKSLGGLFKGGGLAKLLKGGGPLGIISSLLGTLAGDAISGNAPKGKEGAGQRLGGNTLAGAATGAGIGAGVGALFGGIGAVPGAIIGGLIGALTGFFGSAKEDIDQFFSDFVKGWNEFWGTTLPKWWNDLTAGVGDWFEGIGKGWNEFWGVAVPKFWADLGTGVTTWLDGIGKGWDTFWSETFPYWLGYAAGATVRWFEGIGTAWNTFWTVTFPAWVTQAGAAVTQWFVGIGDSWITFWNVTFPAWVAQAGAAVTQWFAGLGAAWSTFWAETFPKWYETAKTNVTNWVKGIGPAWTNFWSVTFPRWLASAKAQVKRWIDGIGPAWNNFWNVTLPAFGRDLLKEASDFIAGLSKGWDEWWNGVKNSIGSWWANFWSGFSAGHGDPQGAHNGGAIRRAGGGGVPGHGNSDTVPAMLTPGEFVVRNAIVDRVGLDNLIKFNAGVMSYAQLLQQAMAGQSKPKEDMGGGLGFFNGGGLVPTINSGGGSGGSNGPRFPKPGDGPAGVQMQFGDINIINPTKERASNSLSVTAQKLAHLGLDGGGL